VGDALVPCWGSLRGKPPHGSAVCKRYWLRLFFQALELGYGGRWRFSEPWGTSPQTPALWGPNSPRPPERVALTGTKPKKDGVSELFFCGDGVDHALDRLVNTINSVFVQCEAADRLTPLNLWTLMEKPSIDRQERSGMIAQTNPWHNRSAFRQRLLLPRQFKCFCWSGGQSPHLQLKHSAVESKQFCVVSLMPLFEKANCYGGSSRASPEPMQVSQRIPAIVDRQQQQRNRLPTKAKHF
jgi:hypothetical protein